MKHVIRNIPLFVAACAGICIAYTGSFLLTWIILAAASLLQEHIFNQEN